MRSLAMRADVALSGSGPAVLAPSRPARPLLKWAGGKRQLLPRIRPFYPVRFERYIEPFVGSGAVFFDLYNHGRLAGRRSILIDHNADLIGCYATVRDHPAEVIRHLARLAAGHAANPREHYYVVRDKEFNPARRRILDAGVQGSARYTPALAAMLIYLNRTGFNGLFRLNSRGGFNVPIGRYANPRICDEPTIRGVATALAAGVELAEDNFERVLGYAEAGDFVYFDPPYAPLTRTALFTSYTAGGFSLADQERLQQVVLQLAARGCRVLLSNSTAPDIARLYDGNPDAASAGLRAHKVPARRAINSDAARRGAVLEYLVTNIPCGRGGSEHAAR